MAILYWITGLSGAGKSTIGMELLRIVREKAPGTVYLDGDQLRDVFGVTDSYSSSDRLALAMQYSRLSKMLLEQGLNVICATISMFRVCQKWNRENISGYREIYIRVPFYVLKERDPKQLYSRCLRGECHDVMGVDIPFLEPQNPDLILDNDGSIPPVSQAKRILHNFPLTG